MRPHPNTAHEGVHPYSYEACTDNGMHTGEDDDASKHRNRRRLGCHCMVFTSAVLQPDSSSMRGAGDRGSKGVQKLCWGKKKSAKVAKGLD
jgi:hypothetical protein